MYYEIGEIRRTIEELDLKISVEELVEKFEQAPEVVLTENIWGMLDNSDNNVKTKEDVLERLKVYDRSPYAYKLIKLEIDRGIWYPPLIIKFSNDLYYLVAGNTRLMVSKVLGFSPTVKIVENVF